VARGHQVVAVTRSTGMWAWFQPPLSTRMSRKRPIRPVGYLAEVDAVVNCAGTLQDGPADSKSAFMSKVNRPVQGLPAGWHTTGGAPFGRGDRARDADSFLANQARWRSSLDGARSGLGHPAALRCRRPSRLRGKRIVAGPGGAARHGTGKIRCEFRNTRVYARVSLESHRRCLANCENLRAREVNPTSIMSR
jgi:hypothetical protein